MGREQWTVARYLLHGDGGLAAGTVHHSLAGQGSAGRISNEIVHIVDLFTTLARVGGAEVPKDPLRGSLADVVIRLRDARSAPQNRHTAATAACPFGGAQQQTPPGSVPIQIMELREPWARSRCPSGPTHRGSRTRENGRLRQYDGLPSRYSHRRFLRGAASLHGSREPKLGLRVWLLRSVQPTEILA